MSRVTRVETICDACDKSIVEGDAAISYPLALSAQIDLHKSCAEQQPQLGRNSEMARKARMRTL